MDVLQSFQSLPYLSITAVVVLFVTYIVLDNYDFIPSDDVVKNLPTAGRGNWLTGHFRQYYSSDDPDLFSTACYNRLGPIHTISGFFGQKRIVIQDSKALAHMVKNGYDYPKNNIVRGEMGRALGHGLLYVEGDDHKRQRKMLNPAFSQNNVRELAPIFTNLALQLADQLGDLVDQEAKKLDDKIPGLFKRAQQEEGVVLDCYGWFFRVALDAIGIGGFGRNYGAVHDAEQKVPKCFSLWSTNEAEDFSLHSLIYRVLSIILPLSVKRIPFISTERQIIVENVKQELNEDSRNMYDERKAWLAKGGGADDDSKDVLTLLMKGNVEATGKDKLSDDEVFAQIKTFIFAGHETSSTGLSWTFYLLAQNPRLQYRLREEISRAKAEAGDEQISPEVLATLPFLDAVLRESLRCRPPIPSRSSVAMKDDVIPLANPIKLSNGRVITELPIKKGQEFCTWHSLTNKRKDIWGSDASQFNPDRWLNDPEAGKKGDLKGAALYSQMMTFFGGPRSCIGYRFAITEMKAIIAILIERFQFHDVGVPISARTFIVMRPAVEGEDGKLTNQMPLRITRVKTN